MEVPHIAGQVHRHQDLQPSVIARVFDGSVLRRLAPAGIGNDRHLGKGTESTVQAAQVHVYLAAPLLDVSFRFCAQREIYGAAIGGFRDALPLILPPGLA